MNGASGKNPVNQVDADQRVSVLLSVKWPDGIFFNNTHVGGTC